MDGKQFIPKFFTLIREGISRDQLQRDIIAGVIVGIVALPLAIAFAIASGVSPEKGIITAIVAGFIISLLGGSRVQIGGPTGAFIAIVYSVILEYGVEGLIISTMLAGILLVIMGLFQLGNLFRFVPYTLVVGFTSGIAVIIFTSQLKDIFGLNIDNIPSDFFSKLVVYRQNWGEINVTATIIAVATIVISFQFHRVSRKIPGSVIAIILSTMTVLVFDLPVPTIGSVFGSIPNSISIPEFPQVDLGTIRMLIQPAFAIALLGGIESLLSATVSDGMTGGRHRPNIELIAQGIANCFSSLFGGLPATGAIARTATNVRSGGRTPIAGITHSVVLLAIMLILAPYVRHIPMASLAGILVVVSYHMSEWRQFKSLLRANRMDVLIMLSTFFLTIIFDLVIAIEIGMVLSSFALMKRLSESTTIRSTNELSTAEGDDGERLFEQELPTLANGIELYEINGALFFGAAHIFQDTLRSIGSKPRVIILRMRNVPFIDATGIYRLMEVIRQFNDNRVRILLSGVHKNVIVDLEAHDIYSLIGKDDINGDIGSTLKRANEYLSKDS